MTDPIRILAANLNKDRPGDRQYLRLLRTWHADVTCLSEYGRGRFSTRIRGRVFAKGRRPFGRFGAHRWAATALVNIGGSRVRVYSVHGLHKRTVGRRAAGLYYDALATKTWRLTAKGREWIVAGDLNLGHKAAARLLGGTSVGEGVDGVIVSPGLTVRLESVDRRGIKLGWTDHPAVIARVTRRKS